MCWQKTLPHEKQTSLKGAFLSSFSKKTYEKQEVLKDIDFEIYKGEFFGIVGRNGSGKSTLLKCIAGVYTPTKGHIQVNGTLVPFIELGVGFNPELSGCDNVFLNGALLGFSRKEMLEMYDDIVEFAELGNFMDQKLKNYSSGMQVRLAFSIAIRARGNILLLDEVLAVGDSAFQQKCFDYFETLKAQNTTIVLVTHNMSIVDRFCNRALLIEDGVIKKIGQSTEIANIYEDLFTNEAMKKREEDKKNSYDTSNSPAVLEKIELVNDKNKSSKSFAVGETMKITVDYQILKDLKEFNIGVGIHSYKSGYAFGCNTQMDGTIIATGKKRGTATLVIENLNVIPGQYFINIICFGRHESPAYDYKQRELSFNVVNDKSIDLHRGIVYLPHKWN